VAETHAQPMDENEYAVMCLNDEIPPAPTFNFDLQIEEKVPDSKTILCDLQYRSSNFCEYVYEKINDGFWYGMYVNFKVIIKMDNGYLNGSKLCNDFDKQMKNWLRNAGTKALIETFKKMHPGVPDQVSVKGGKKMIETRGTYIHQQLVPSLVAWISPEYALHMYNVINAFNLAMTAVAPQPAAAAIEPDASSISSDDDFVPAPVERATIYYKNVLMAPLPTASNKSLQNTKHDEYPLIMAAYSNEKTRERHTKRVCKLYPNASVYLSDIMLKPDMKSLRKFLKSQKINFLGMHLSDVPNKHLFNSY
jgi:hypothetical protein